MYATRSVFAGWILAAVLCVVALTSNAPVFGGAVMFYPDVSTSLFDYSQINESSFTDSLPLFGPPTGAGEETLRFDSGMNFSAAAGVVPGNVLDVTDGKLFVKIKAKSDGGNIAVVTLNELGGLGFAGIGGTSATQVTSATLGLSVAINAINGVSVDGPVALGTMKYHLVDANVTIPAEGDVVDGPGVTTVTFPIPKAPGSGTWTGTWTGYATFNLAERLREVGMEGRVTEATLVFDNLLTAQSEAGTAAFIDKKRVWITPEPGTFVLLSIGGIGLAGYSWCMRRRR